MFNEIKQEPWVVRTFIEGLSYNVGPLDPVMPPEFEGYASEPPHHVYVIVKDSKERAEFVALACNSHYGLMEALKTVLPYMEAAEKAGLVGHEGCHWPVEVVRAALAASEGVS